MWLRKKKTGKNKEGRKRMKIVFMGTPDFAVKALEELVQAGHEIVCVVTQPDKPKGRGNQVQISAVKECALKYDLSLFQPRKIKEKEAVEYLKTLEADLFVVAAFGQIWICQDLAALISTALCFLNTVEQRLFSGQF